MDPITLVTATASLAGAVLTASLKIKNTLDHLENAPQNVCDIAEEIYAVQYALSQVEDVVRRDPNVIDRLALEDVFALAVKGCHATLQSIHKEYEELFEKKDWKTKILVLWKDGEMTRLLGRLDRKKATLTLLTQTLNLRSTQDIKDLLVQNQSTLIAARQDSFESIPNKATQSPRARISEPLEDDESGDVFGDNESVLSTTEFDFDFDLINTRAYRRALAQAQAASKRSKPAPFNVDKPLPKLAEEDSPASMVPVPESVAGDVADSIDLSGETMTLQSSLSRATTLRPESELAQLGSQSPVSVTTTNGKQSKPQAEIEVESEAKNSQKTGSDSQVSLVTEEAKNEKDSKQSMRKRMNKHAEKSRLQLAEAKEKANRRKPHGRPNLSKQLSEGGSSFASAETIRIEDAQEQDLSRVAESQSDDVLNKLDSRKHRRCARKTELRHRPRGSRTTSENSGLNVPTISQGLRDMHIKGFSDAVEKVDDAVRQLGLSDHAALRRERIRRRHGQTA
ncbi:hypothetical protein CkaCkLH20_00637 [Colletotrichum karsti]|uniref:Fungal N-terminal domain-containing protein n=1 Tax=Colletotrichum karsti TaxID=1095194 RepID=A0A9P6LQC0_9PEZI|nr:uncharacterized protein CkaCkLH20_00637 [Colletotrichum karsti]KAF9881491.1 hypothetical protein CkaCkLH20_00637 [Colletotrichum karsti]